MIFGGTVAAPYVQLEQADNPLDVVELYSAWIEWIHADFLTRANYPAAMRPVGGDAKTTTTAVGKVVFWQPAWSLRLWEGDQDLEVVGELYPEGGVGSVFQPTTGEFTAIVRMRTPQSSELVSVNMGSGLDAAQAAALTNINTLVQAFYRFQGYDASNPVVLTRDTQSRIVEVSAGTGHVVNVTHGATTETWERET